MLLKNIIYIISKTCSSVLEPFIVFYLGRVLLWPHKKLERLILSSRTSVLLSTRSRFWTMSVVWLNLEPCLQLWGQVVSLLYKCPRYLMSIVSIYSLNILFVHLKYSIMSSYQPLMMSINSFYCLFINCNFQTDKSSWS